MKLSQQRRISYAYAFISYLLRKISPSELEKIRDIYLFGSVVSGNIRLSSDIDIFIDGELNKKIVDRIVEEFYASNFAKFYRKIGVENPINVIVGKLEEWPKLKASIRRASIHMFGKIAKGEREAYLIWWEPPKVPKIKVALHRKLFGYFGARKRYAGLLEERGERIGSNSILVRDPEPFVEIFKKLNVKFKMRRIFL